MLFCFVLLQLEVGVGGGGKYNCYLLLNLPCLSILPDHRGTEGGEWTKKGGRAAEENGEIKRGGDRRGEGEVRRGEGEGYVACGRAEVVATGAWSAPLSSLDILTLKMQPHLDLPEN